MSKPITWNDPAGPAVDVFTSGRRMVALDISSRCNVGFESTLGTASAVEALGDLRERHRSWNELAERAARNRYP